MMRKRTFTLIEVVVGAIIIVIVFGGLLASFVSVRRYVRRAKRRLVAANLVRGVFNDLYHEVRADTWDSGGRLTIGGHENVTNVTIENDNYRGNYTVSGGDIDGDGEDEDYRQVFVNINYPTD